MSRYVDTTAIMQVIGNVFNHPDLLENSEKYKVNEEDFVEDFHRIVYGAMYKLYQLGVKEFTLENINDYLSTREKSKSTYIANKGEEYLLKVSNYANLNTFDYYYDRLKKFTLLRMYDSYGVDVSFIYDDDNIFDVKKKEKQEEQLDNYSLSDIASIVDDKISEVRNKYADGIEDNTYQAGDGIYDLIESLKESPEVGVPLYGPLINTITRGARLKKFYLRSGATGLGKALPNSTLIPTPDGFKTVGEIRKGDYLFDAFGKPTKVIETFPQGEKEVWEVIFKDGRRAKCCEEHLWSFCTANQRKESKVNRKFNTKTLGEINKMPLYKKGAGYQILVPMQKAVEYKEKKYFIKPYSFGLLLGDGSFRYSKNQKGLYFSSENEILPTAIANEMNWTYKKNSEKNFNWTFEYCEDWSHKNVWVEEVLKDYPSLWQAKSEDKFIPTEYLQGSIAQRLDLLNGLLDSDGSVDKEKGRITYCTISKRLRDDVVLLCNSLGFKASWIEDKHKDTNICYHIEIMGTPEDKIKLFKLERKKELILSWFNNSKRKEANLFNPIVEINKLEYKEEMTCFLVDNDEHLFLMNDYIVTHNTRTMIADACYIAADYYYDEDFGWIHNGQKEPTLYITTEQEVSEIQTMMLAFVSNVNEEKIINGTYEGDEEDRVIRAAEILTNTPIYIKELPDFSLDDIENVIKTAIKEHGVKYVFHDYIHSSLKILEEIGTKTNGMKLREDNILFMLSTRLKDLCNKYEVFLLSGTQLSGNYLDSETPDQNLLRGAKAIADKIDYGSLILPVTPADLQALEKALGTGCFDTPNIKISVYKNRRGRYKGIFLWGKADLGTCRVKPMFATTFGYELIKIDNMKINVESAF